MSQKPGVMIYFDLLPSVEKMSNHKAGALFKAILDYGQNGNIPLFKDELTFLWPMVQMRLDTDDQRYYQVSQKRRYSAYTRWTKEHDQVPLPFEQWLAEVDRPQDDDQYC